MADMKQIEGPDDSPRVILAPNEIVTKDGERYIPKGDGSGYRKELDAKELDAKVVNEMRDKIEREFAEALFTNGHGRRY